jgi:hypothetical protein
VPQQSHDHSLWLKEVRDPDLETLEGQCHASIKLRLGPIDVYLPPVEFPSARVDEGNFVFQPEQGPLASILAHGSLIQPMQALNFGDRPAGNAMLLKKL